MKNLLFIFVGILFLSCSNNEDTEKPEEPNQKKASLTVKNTDTLKYKVIIMEAFPTEGGPKITKQAEHYKVSKLVWDESAIYYVYQPKEGFTGIEKVEITNSFHNGAEVYDKEVIKLTIEVTE